MTQTTLSSQFTHTHVKGICPMGHRSKVEYGQPLLTVPTGLHDDGTFTFLLCVDDSIIIDCSQVLIINSVYTNLTGLWAAIAWTINTVRWGSVPPCLYQYPSTAPWTCWSPWIWIFVRYSLLQRHWFSGNLGDSETKKTWTLAESTFLLLPKSVIGIKWIFLNWVNVENFWTDIQLFILTSVVHLAPLKRPMMTAWSTDACPLESLDWMIRWSMCESQLAWVYVRNITRLSLPS